MQLRVPTAVLILATLPAAARAQDFERRLVSYTSAFEQDAQPKQLPPVAPQPKQPDPKAPDPMGPNPIERLMAPAFARGTEAGGFAARSFNENFDGDNRALFYRQSVIVGFDQVTVPTGFTQQVVGVTQRQVGTTPRVIGFNRTIIISPDGGSGAPAGQPVVITTPVVVQDPVFVLDPVIATTQTTGTVLVPRRAVVVLPVASRYSAVQITDNDSPRPTDRVYGGYQFYSDAGASLNPDLGGTDAQVQTAGFELTFLDGDASVGMRLPFVQQYGPVGFASQTVGDVSVLFKYAFYNDLATGNLASAGLVVTAPTGGGNNIVLIDGSTVPHSTLFQPWLGFVRVFDAGYVQGITNLIVPTDSRDPTVYGASVGVGFFAYDNPAGVLTGIVPRAEVHLRTPFNHRDPAGLTYYPDQVNVNGGLTFRFGRTSLNAGVSVPVVGPRPWAVEAMSFLNVAF